MKPQSAAAPCARSVAKKNIKLFRGVGSALTGRLQTALLRSAPPGLAPHRYVPVAAAPGTPAARRRFPLHGNPYIPHGQTHSALSALPTERN